MTEERKCRVCGCTDNDCSQCIEKTGGPCHWVEEDLCSACQSGFNLIKNAEGFTSDSDGESILEFSDDDYEDSECWLCNCGNYIEDGFHCPICRAEPPWGCPCSDCSESIDEDDFDFTINIDDDDIDYSEDEFEG